MNNIVSADIENVLIKGDLAALNNEQRINYYGKVCESIGLNPLTQPFEYIKLNGRLQLYAKKACTDQLRKINGVSITSPNIDYLDGLVVVTVTATDKSGRTDTDVGVVDVGSLKGERKSNALMKAITKAKRRVTLSICGLGMLDETEIESIPEAQIQQTEPAAISFEPKKHYYDFTCETEQFEWLFDNVIKKHDGIHKGGAYYEFDKKVSLKLKDGSDKLEQFYVGQELPDTNGHIEDVA